MRQNYKFYAKKRKNTKPKELPQQNRVEKMEQEKQQQRAIFTSNKCRQQYQLTTESNITTIKSNISLHQIRKIY